MKLRLIAVAVAALVMTAGTAVAQDTSSEKGKLSYALGYQQGQQLLSLIERGEQLDLAAVAKGMQDAASKKDPSVAVDQLRPAYEAFQKREIARAQKAKADWDKMVADNKTKSTTFLNQNKAKAGVKVLPSGIQYRVIEEGKGPKPTQSSTVQVDAMGGFPFGQRPADAKVESMKPVKVSEIQVTGIREVLLQMPQGSKWEVTLPAEKAYGADPRIPFPPAAAVQFELKLVSVK